MAAASTLRFNMLHLLNRYPLSYQWGFVVAMKDVDKVCDSKHTYWDARRE